jgi:hypothetical protein
MLVITVVFAYWGLTQLKDPMTGFARMEEAIIKMETRANDNYNKSLTEADRTKRLELLQTAIRDIEQCAQQSGSLPVKGLNDVVSSRKKLLMAYYAQKLIAFNAEQKGVNENTDRYDAIIADAFSKCDSLLQLDK